MIHEEIFKEKFIHNMATNPLTLVSINLVSNIISALQSQNDSRCLVHTHKLMRRVMYVMVANIILRSLE